MSPPRVSVVLPTYNAADFVESSIQSILSSTYEDFEVLVIDDGSTDGTVEKVKEIEDERVRLVRRDESGLPSALNRGISEARGEYIARQDADDRSHPDRLAKQVEFLDQSPEVAGVGTGAYLISTDGTRLNQRHVLEKVGMEDMQGGNRFIHGTMLLRKAIVEKVGGYDESLEYTEDYDLWVRILNEAALRNIDEPLYELRLHQESIYGSELSTVKLLRRFAYRRARGSLPDEARESILEHGAESMFEYLSPEETKSHYVEMAVELLRYGQTKEARSAARNALHISWRSPLAYLIFILSVCPDPVIRTVVDVGRLRKNRRIQKINRERDR